MSHHRFRLCGKTAGSLKETVSAFTLNVLCERRRRAEVVRVPLAVSPYNPRQAFTHVAGTPARDQYSRWALGKSASMSRQITSHRFIVCRCAGSRGREGAREELLVP